MGVMRTMGSSGDTAVVWGTRPKELEPPYRELTVKEVEDEFQRIVAQHYLAFTAPAPGKTPERIEKFDPNAEEILIVPPLVGGAV